MYQHSLNTEILNADHAALRTVQRYVRGPMKVVCLAAILLALPGGITLNLVATASADEDVQAQQRTHFEKHVRPLLVTKCLKCHGKDKQEGGLRLDTAAAILNGGDSGPAVVPGNPKESLLIQAIHYDGREMPPSGKLEPSEITRLEQWVSTGAMWPDDLHELRPEPHGISEEDRKWWAFQPIHLPEVPGIPNDTWSRNPIDRFVLERLNAEGLTPAPQASRETLVRRLFYDVIGLPPTPEEIDAFVHDASPDAWEQLVDRLLNDSRYGEHWARSWLDLVRYSESDGWNQDAYRPHLWRYRDYVIRSLNADKPYPQFVREQLAGDEIGGDNPENLAAVGFLRLGIYEYNQRDARGQWNDIMNEMTDVTADVFLGMGMACARCHNHKFDPILQTDYFRLRAFFEPVIWRDNVTAATDVEKEAYKKALVGWEEATAEIRQEIDELLKPYNDRKWKSTADKFPLDIQACFYKPVEQRNSWEHQMAYLISRQFLEEGGGPLKSLSKEDKEKYDGLEKRLAEFDHLKPAPLPEVMTVSDFPGAVAPTVIPDVPQPAEIAPGILTVLSPSEAGASLDIPAVPNSSGRRLALAEWIGSRDNPLTTRVIVNRIWQQHFGQGLVATASDFGHQGQLPSHPQLLDWLTATFVENGWSFRQLHRLILTSATWQQSANHPDAGRQQSVDLTDSLLWRARVRRLRAEQIRDAMLACSGELDGHLGGPSVDASEPRRAIYVKSLRNTPEPFLHAFDVANGLQSSSERSNTTTPLQALLMVNGRYAIDRASGMAERMKKQEFVTTDEMLTALFRLTWGRQPNPTELSRALTFVVSSDASGNPAGAGADDDPTAAVDMEKLADFCHVLFNSNEFLYVD